VKLLIKHQKEMTAQAMDLLKWFLNKHSHRFIVAIIKTAMKRKRHRFIVAIIITAMKRKRSTTKNTLISTFSSELNT
jgi:hypothetical protein